MGQNLIGLIIGMILLVPIAFATGILLSIFSPELRKRMRVRWWAYVLAGGIIILLAAVLFPANPGGIRVAKGARTQATMSQIQTAFLAYQTEYETPPPGRGNATIIRELMDSNPRHIAFLNLNPARDMNAGGEALDAWGTPLRIALTDPKHPLVQSAGPDKTWDTPDDVTLQLLENPNGL